MALESVDNALRLLLLLAERDELGVTEAAHLLGIAPSTAHRLFTTLRERGFVVQADNRNYRRGPAMSALAGRPSRSLDLVTITRPALEALRDGLDETCHLMVRDGRSVRFLASVEADQVLRVGSRAGAVLPAHLVSGGKLLLADLEPPQFARLYPATGVPEAGLDAGAVARLRRELRTVKRRGYAVNNGQSEPGLAAVAVAIHDPQGSTLGAISVSVPTVRYYPARVPEIVGALKSATETATRALAAA
jgi:DNA-binding IclR family transcriptional regulator